MRRMKRLRSLGVVGAAVLAAAVAVLVPGVGTVAATVGPGAQPSPQLVTIVSTMTIAYPAPNYGTFQASGSNLICGSGTVLDSRLVYLRGPGTTGYDLTVDKTFTCADRSGKIFVRLFAHNVGSGETFGWEILGGTGRYRHLDGLGVGSTVGPNANVATNTYTGALVD